MRPLRTPKIGCAQLISGELFMRKRIWSVSILCLLGAVPLAAQIIKFVVRVRRSPFLFGALRS